MNEEAALRVRLERVKSELAKYRREHQYVTPPPPQSAMTVATVVLALSLEASLAAGLPAALQAPVHGVIAVVAFFSGIWLRVAKKSPRDD
jgi:hypothetical protein